MNSAGNGADFEGRSPVEDEETRVRRAIRAELEDHVARRARALEREGLTQAEARAEALRRLGDAERIERDLLRIAARDRRRKVAARWLDEVTHDTRLALRGMRRRPALTMAVLATLGLAIGAAAAVFGAANAVLFQPLNFPASGRLFSVYTRYLPATGYDFEYFSISGPEYDDYRAMTRSMSAIALFGGGPVNVAPGVGEPERVTRVVGSANLLDVLGVPPALGRGFSPGEDAPGRACVTVLSDGFWRERFGADPSVVGRVIRLDGEVCEVIGVMPPGFWFPVERVRLWTTLELDRSSDITWHRLSHPYMAVARLAPGATREQATAELDVLRASLSAAHPDHYANGHFVVLRPLLDDLVGEARPTLLVLLGAVGLVLLIVCVNLAGLLLSAAESRRREFAVRVALGIGRGRLVRQVLTESILLSLLGGALGVFTCVWLIRVVLRLYPGGLPRGAEVGVDGTVLWFTTGIAVVAGILFGLLPALQASAMRAGDAMRATARGLTVQRSGVRARRWFVVAQTGLALTLMVGALLLAQSYSRLRSVDLGFNADEVLVFNVTVPPASYPEAALARAYFARLEDRLAAVPGVLAVGAIAGLPLRFAGGADDFIIEGRPVPAPGELQWNARYQMATPRLRDALGLRLIRGRWFEDTDRAGTPPVAVITEATARTYFPGEDALGRRIRYYDADAPWITIVGIIADVRSLGVGEAAPPTVFTALAQAPRSAYAGRSMYVAVRFRERAVRGVDEVRAAIADIDPTLPASQLTTLGTVVTESMGGSRFALTLMSGFAGLALLLGALGLYAVVAQTVHQRGQEIGLRFALGARRVQVLQMIVAQGLGLAVLGTTLGLGTAVLFRNTLDSLLFGIPAFDPATLAFASITLIGISLLACAIPAWRAARVDPALALRAE